MIFKGLSGLALLYQYLCAEPTKPARQLADFRVCNQSFVQSPQVNKATPGNCHSVRQLADAEYFFKGEVN
ncbi:MAG TPA: hypothetical protein VIJ27_03375 [Mucilaginibacter sp.]